MTVLAGTIRVPGSKSLTHRAYLLAAQSDQPSTVAAPLRSADTDATLGCLHRLGHRFKPGDRAVEFLPASATPPTEPLDCRNSGTTLRLMLGTTARHPFPVTLTGDASLCRRPNAPLIAAITQLGARVRGTDTAPFTVQGPVGPGDLQLPSGISSQYVSSLLLALPMLRGESNLQLTPPVSSRPYIDMTREIAADFGLQIHENGDAFHMPGNDTPRKPVYRVEGDWSTAAFPLVGAAITGGDVSIEGLRHDSLQGDRAILAHLETFGCTVHASESTLRVRGGSLEAPGTIDVSSTPDMFPALAVLAAYARGTTTFTGGAALRHKESDRIAAMATGLQQLGVEVKETPDGLEVRGGPVGGGSIHAHDDHRIHMAFQIAALGANGNVHVDGAESAAVSYPQFHADLERLKAGAA